MNQQITIDTAYREACLALGESIVQQRLLGNEVQRLTTEAQASGTDTATQEATA